MEQKIVTVGYGDVKKVQIGGTLPLAFVGGPCAIENRDHALFMAESIAEICEKLDIPWIYKSCYDKDCRSSPKSFHGVGIDKGLKILSGKDKAKEGEVIEIDRENNRAKVKDLNMIKKHVKTTKEKKGGIFSKENFIHISNLKLIEEQKKNKKTVAKK